MLIDRWYRNSFTLLLKMDNLSLHGSCIVNYGLVMHTHNIPVYWGIDGKQILQPYELY